MEKKYTFKAEVQQVLDIVINSLYTDKEIFVRELISNASDALEKLRHIQLTEKAIFDEDLELAINVTSDDNTGTMTIQDFGIGMTREELVENLGKIAHSGSKAFLEALKQKNSSAETCQNLIGQFGVGFYSAFMVAKEVKVYTHSWREDAESLLWVSKGAGEYTIEASQGQRRGCKIVLTLKDDCKSFASASQLKTILERYSGFVNFPINLNGERINTINALWLRSKSDIKEKEYQEFYKFQAKAFDEPLSWLHFSADAPLALNALLFIPSQNTESLAFGRMEPGVALHCRKILIDPKPEGLLPDWLRFLKGVVDSADLPLNISRETMQDSALVQKINRVLTKRFLKQLEEDAKKRPETFQKFYDTFAAFLKEGVANDFSHRNAIAKLLRYESSLSEAGKTTSLVDYLSRAKDEQKEIYYLHGPNRAAIENSPYLEAFKARGLEVLYLYEPMDEFVMGHLREFDDKKLVSADQAEIDVDTQSSQAQKDTLGEADTRALCDWLKTTLGERVEKVQPSKRLLDSPAMVLNTDKMMTPGMRRMMKAMHQPLDGAFKVTLDINPGHALIQGLSSLREQDASKAKIVAEQVLDNALIDAGHLDDPRSMVPRLYSLLETIVRPQSQKPSAKNPPVPASTKETSAAPEIVTKTKATSKERPAEEPVKPKAKQSDKD